MGDGRLDATGDGVTSRSHEIDRVAGVLRVGRPTTEWLHTGWNGGRTTADAAYNVTVPTDWNPSDIHTWVSDQLATAGFDEPGPVLLTGVSMAHVRGARYSPVTVYATAGVSNPAALPMDPPDVSRSDEPTVDDASGDGEADGGTGAGNTPSGVGTVNLLILVDRTLGDGALANLLAVAAEAKAATLLDRTGFPGTTTDAVTVGHDPTGEPIPYSGSATSVGGATRACVRDALTASLRSRYGQSDNELPRSVDEAEHGVSTDARADVFEIDP
ncbi:adenosylcobinamide amidohydrolase [Halovivax gelatinilyticus]|uniref:adenosylcobinamide amidohydrolase n=1 Tax=Halovivax gelatinilyticus TaxID=2961597 RepID=UPI0020CA858A|nr:adenosylcobinamide amidohydrolase [Halovivax gelatinilyticus]